MVIVLLLSFCVIMSAKVTRILSLSSPVGHLLRKMILLLTSVSSKIMVSLVSYVISRISSFFVSGWLLMNLILLWIRITLLILQLVLILLFNLIDMKEKTKNFWTFVLTIAKYGIALAIGWISGDTDVINSIL